jgi:thiamine biosynthesis lipoprotein
VIERHAFRAMGTEMELLVEPTNGCARRAFAAAVDEFERLEQIMSRFRPDSELSHLNRERALDASLDLVRVVELALDARERTDGRFDPTVHDALVAAGYDRTFDEVESDGPATVDGGAACLGGVAVHNGRIELEPGVKLDLGGIGKGYAAERAAELLATAGPCLVNAGGDVAVRGDVMWPVGVETSDGQLTLALDRGGLATSGRDRRRWTRGGEQRHHLIDPQTGRPARSDLLRVTVVAGDAVEAEVLAKALFVSGAEAAAQTDASAVLVTEAGETVLTGALRR